MTTVITVHAIVKIAVRNQYLLVKAQHSIFQEKSAVSLIGGKYPPKNPLNIFYLFAAVPIALKAVMSFLKSHFPEQLTLPHHNRQNEYFLHHVIVYQYPDLKKKSSYSGDM